MAATHFYWNPKKDFVKYAQGLHLLANISEFLKKHKLSLDDQKTDSTDTDANWHYNTPLILSGDFNTEPDHSFIHQIYDKKYLLDKASGRVDPKTGHPAYCRESSVELFKQVE